MGMRGVRMLPLSITLVETEMTALMAEDADAISEMIWCDELANRTSAPPVLQLSDIVKDAIKRPRKAIKSPVVSSDADTTASEDISESASRGSLEAPEVVVEEPAASEVVSSVEFTSNASATVVPENPRQFIRDTKKREDLLRSVVVQLKSQRTDAEKENVRLQQELVVKDSLLSAAEICQPQLCVRQAKRFEQQRSKRTQKQVKQHRQQEQQRFLEIEATRCEGERRAREITAHALAQADAIRVAARERRAEVNSTLLQRKMEHCELQKRIDHKKSVLAAVTEQQQQVQKDLDDTHVEAAEQLFHIQSELQETLAIKENAQAAASEAAVQLQGVLASVEQQSRKLQALAALETKAVMIAEESTLAVDNCSRQAVLKANTTSFKSAKEIERQRALKQNKQAAHHRSLKRQKEAERCRMREEIEKERANMLTAAEKELSAMKARIKSQSQALRQKKRRATAVRESEATAGSPARHDASRCKEARHEEPAQLQETFVAVDSFFDSSNQQDAVSSVETAEVILDSSNEDSEVPEVEAQGQSQEGEALEEDWQVLSEGSEDNEVLWDLVG